MRRILSAVVLIAILGFTIWTLPAWATAAVAVIAAALAGVELVGLATRANAPLSAAFVGFSAADGFSAHIRLHRRPSFGEGIFV